MLQGLVQKQSKELWHMVLMLRLFFTDLGIKVKVPTHLYHENHAALYISENPMFHEWIKCIEADYLIREDC